MPARKMLVSDIVARVPIFPDNRVNVVGIVVGAAASQFLLDDGKQIAVRNYDVTVLPGEAVLVIARVQQMETDVYLTSEMVRRIDPLWVKVRQLELLGRKEIAATPRLEAADIPKESRPQDYVAQMIRSLDSGQGVLIDELVRRSSFSGCKEVIEALIREGEVFEIEPGRVKILE